MTFEIQGVARVASPEERGTPPEHLLFNLRKALDMLFEEGLDTAIRHHALLAEATRHAVSRWADSITSTHCPSCVLPAWVQHLFPHA